VDNLLMSPYLIPLAALCVGAIAIVAGAWTKVRSRELQAHHDLRMSQMEHERKLKELEIERLKASGGQG